MQFLRPSGAGPSSRPKPTGCVRLRRTPPVATILRPSGAKRTSRKLSRTRSSAVSGGASRIVALRVGRDRQKWNARIESKEQTMLLAKTFSGCALGPVDTPLTLLRLVGFGQGAVPGIKDLDCGHRPRSHRAIARRLVGKPILASILDLREERQRGGVATTRRAESASKQPGEEGKG